MADCHLAADSHTEHMFGGSAHVLCWVITSDSYVERAVRQTESVMVIVTCIVSAADLRFQVAIAEHEQFRAMMIAPPEFETTYVDAMLH